MITHNESGIPSHNRPAGATDSATRYAEMPGCVIGIPVVTGVPAQLLIPSDGFRASMRFIEADDYRGLMMLALGGPGQIFDEHRRCAFSCDLNPGNAQDMPKCLDVRHATLLQYAVCMGAFRAAAALIIICPGYLLQTCYVFLSSTGSTKIVQWSTTDLIHLFCRLYCADEGALEAPLEEDPDVVDAREHFSRALAIFEMAEARPSSIPFLGLPTLAERVATAGFDPEPVIAALSAASQASLVSAPMMCD